MKFVGAHVSISGGVSNSPERATEIGANALGIFTKNQRQWKVPPLSDDEIERFKSELAKAKIEPEHVVVHDSYLINIGNPDVEKRKKSLDALLDETIRVERLGLVYLNFHPGSGMKEISEAETLTLIAEGVNEVLAQTKSAVLLLEATAGQGAHVGYQFEQLTTIIEKIDSKKRIGVCLDTCHIFVAGYDIRTPETYGETMKSFNKIVGLKYLKALHLNDAKNELGSRVDRHACLGEGHLDWQTFKNIMVDKRLDDIPMVLETPDKELWKEEVAALMAMAP